MKKDKLYRLLKKRMMLMSSLPPQEVGILTPYWRKVIPHFKTMPLTWLIFTGLFSGFTLWILLGARLVRLVSILQYGF